MPPSPSRHSVDKSPVPFLLSKSMISLISNSHSKLQLEKLTYRNGPIQAQDSFTTGSNLTSQLQPAKHPKASISIRSWTGNTLKAKALKLQIRCRLHKPNRWREPQLHTWACLSTCTLQTTKCKWQTRPLWSQMCLTPTASLRITLINMKYSKIEHEYEFTHKKHPFKIYIELKLWKGQVAYSNSCQLEIYKSIGHVPTLSSSSILAKMLSKTI